MELKIGIARGGQVLDVELAEDVDRDALRTKIEEALSGNEGGVFWVTDKKGKELAVAAASIAFIQLGNADSTSIGFGA